MATATSLCACPQCDLLVKRKALGRRQVARCPRCRAPLYRESGIAPQSAAALLLAAIVLWLAANLLPFLSLTVAGVPRENRLITGVLELHDQGHTVLAIVVFIACIAAPLAYFLGSLWALVSPRAAVRLRAFLEHLRPWGMLDVFLLGVLVALIRLSQMADVHLGHGFYAYLGLFVISIVAAVAAESTPIGRSAPVAGATGPSH